MCGLFGFVGQKPTTIDKLSLLTLGTLNDSRGGDSCGLFIDDSIEYGVDKNKFFELFYRNSELLKSKTEAQVILGHCRKASVGTIDIQTAQPVVIYNDEGQVDFVMIHNGTIVNYKELADKYLTDCEDYLTDSQIMAYIIYYHGFKVFGEYIGAGAFVCVDYRTPNREPSVYVFHGLSKESSYKQNLSEERPLYYVRTPQGIWFSSQQTYLDILAYNYATTTFSLPTNQVCLLNHEFDKLILVEEYDRTSLFQKDYSYTKGRKQVSSSSFVPATTNTNTNTRYYYYGYPYSYEDEYDDYIDYSSTITPTTPGVIAGDNKQTSLILNDFPKSGQIVFHNYQYWFNEKLAHGMFILDQDGTIDYKHGRPFYFYQGVPIYGKKVFDALMYITEDYLGTTPETIMQMWWNIVYNYSPLAYFNPITQMYYVYYKAVAVPVEGKHTPLFQKNPIYTYNFELGKLKNVINTHGTPKRWNKAYTHLIEKYSKYQTKVLIEQILEYVNNI